MSCWAQVVEGQVPHRNPPLPRISRQLHAFRHLTPARLFSISRGMDLESRKCKSWPLWGLCRSLASRLASEAEATGPGQPGAQREFRGWMLHYIISCWTTKILFMLYCMPDRSLLSIYEHPGDLAVRNACLAQLQTPDRVVTLCIHPLAPVPYIASGS